MLQGGQGGVIIRKVIIFLVLCSIAFADNPYRAVNNLNSGELSPLLNAREDLAKFQSGLSIMENAIPVPQGGAEKRPGTKYIAEVKDSAAKTRLLPFEFSTTQSYIIEAGNQYFRFFTDGSPVFTTLGTEDLSGIGGIVAHWLLNDNLATTAVLDDDGGTHDGIAEDNTDTYSTADESGAANKAFNLNGTDEFVTITDHDDFSFGDGSTDSAFSIAAWVNFDSSGGSTQNIISKGETAQFEWRIQALNDDLLLFLADVANGGSIGVKTDMALTDGWHFVVATYNGDGSRDGIALYVDWVKQTTVDTGAGVYVAMDNLAANVLIGAEQAGASGHWKGGLNNIAIFSKELTAVEIASLTGGESTTPAEIITPYLTADLFNLKYEQSADILYITHPDYETRKLLRLGNSIWSLGAAVYQSGPFRVQNSETNFKIAASATTGPVTLMATGHAPFIVSSTLGHIPSGASSTDKSNTGALFRLVHPLGDLSFADTLEDDIDASSTEGVSWMACGTLYKGARWTWVTGGTWLGTVAVQRNYTIGAAFADAGWETVLPFDGVVTARNVSTSGSEDGGDADYRVAFLDDTSGTVEAYFTTNQTEVVGIVEITSVTSTTEAIGTVVKTLASTDATYKWSEGSWSNYRGWPATASFFEDRLMFGGNIAQPDTIWGSRNRFYDDMTAGADDSDAVIFTLSSRQVNVIEWMVGKDKLLIGTSGAEWTIAGGTDEPLSPSNVIAKQHSTYGSANLQANLANESVLFFQRGAEKMRELAYNWELDTYIAPDMTILANTVTNTGITDTAFQRTPNSILWTTRTDGEMPIFSYERAENITAWSRMITQTNLAGTLTDSDIESVAVINGSPEDEVWVIVERIVDANTVRYIEQFQPRDFGDSTDAIFVDSCVTYDSTASSAMTGLDHLNGQTVYVLADGVEFDTEVVAGGAITLSLNNVATTASTVQMGLVYEVQLRTMPLSWIGGPTIQGKQKKISEVISRWYKSGDFSIGRDIDNLQPYAITNQTTSIDRKTFSTGWDREGFVFVYQKSPEPLTLLSIMMEFNLQ